MEEKQKNKMSGRGKKVLCAIFATIVLVLSFLGGYYTRYATENKDIRSIRYILDCYKKYYYFEENDVVDIFADALLDDYSDYYTKEEYELVQKASQGKREGMGVVIVKSNLEISEVCGNSPAEKAGVKSGGIIVSINGEHIENYDDFSSKIDGVNAYTDFSLGVDYDGVTQTFTLQKKEYTQTYAFYHDSSVYAHFTTNGSGKIDKVVEDLTPYTDIIEDEDTAYIRFSSFNGYTGESNLDNWKNNLGGAAGQFYSALQTFKQNGRHKLIIDLRGNGGGYVAIAQSIGAHLLEDGNNKTPLFSVEKYKGGKTKKINTATVDYSDYGYEKIIFLADEGSASASEMLMGAVLDYDKKSGKNIVNVVLESSLDSSGQTVYKSYGKGIMQEYFENYLTGEVVKLTVAKLFWPVSDVTIHGVGITKDLDGRVIESMEQGKPVDALHTAINLCK